MIVIPYIIGYVDEYFNESRKFKVSMIVIPYIIGYVDEYFNESRKFKVNIIVKNVSVPSYVKSNCNS